MNLFLLQNSRGQKEGQTPGVNTPTPVGPVQFRRRERGRKPPDHISLPQEWTRKVGREGVESETDRVTRVDNATLFTVVQDPKRSGSGVRRDDHPSRDSTTRTHHNGARWEGRPNMRPVGWSVEGTEVSGPKTSRTLLVTPTFRLTDSSPSTRGQARMKNDRSCDPLSRRLNDEEFSWCDSGTSTPLRPPTFGDLHMRQKPFFCDRTHLVNSRWIRL